MRISLLKRCFTFFLLIPIVCYVIKLSRRATASVAHVLHAIALIEFIKAHTTYKCRANAQDNYSLQGSRYLHRRQLILHEGLQVFISSAGTMVASHICESCVAFAAILVITMMIRFYSKDYLIFMISHIEILEVHSKLRYETRRVAVDLWGFLWVTLPFVHMMLANFSASRSCLFVLFCVWNVDNGALIAGTFLAPIWNWKDAVQGLSQSKSWVGISGGLSLGVVTAMALRLHAQGPLISILAVAGDLIESALKRIILLKDSGHLFPGHGGCLDRLDSVILAVVSYYYADRCLSQGGVLGLSDALVLSKQA